jgi:FkbM family methyltransferase
MKKIVDTLSAYQNDQISKSDFIQEMYEMHHMGLFDYADHLKKTNVKKIEIEDGRVVMTSRDRGARMHCVPGDYRVAPLETLNFFDYEKRDSAVMDGLIEDDFVFFDIGANIGWYSINLALAHRFVQIHSFEPIPTTYKYLERNLKLNHLSNVITYNFGFSDRSGEFDFYFYNEGSGNASSANLSNREDVQVCKCQVRTLDEFTAEKNTKVDFIKCDVEGAEFLVYKGGLETIKRDQPIVFSEILRKWSAKFDYDPNEIFSLFSELGYQAFTAKDKGLQEFFQMDELTLDTNFFFLHKQKHSQQIKKFTV